MATPRHIGRQPGVRIVKMTDKPGRVKRAYVLPDPKPSSGWTVVEAQPAKVTDRDDAKEVALDASDFAFIEFTDRVLAKARAVQRDPSRRRPRLRFR
jgi:hypothetical protein